jgi:preprotein translocase subunit YajC
VEGLLLPILLAVGMYFLLIRPQQRRMKDQQTLQRSVGPGDTVVTSSGIYGTVTEIEDDETLLLEISEGIDIRIARGAVVRKVAAAEPATADEVAEDATDDAPSDAAPTDDRRNDPEATDS